MSGAGPGPEEGEALPTVLGLEGALALRGRVAEVAATRARLAPEAAAALPAVVSAVVAAFLAEGHPSVSASLRLLAGGGIRIQLQGADREGGTAGDISVPPLPHLLPGGVEVERQAGGGWTVTAPPRPAEAVVSASPALALVAAETALLRMVPAPPGDTPGTPVQLRPLVEELRAAFAGRAMETGVTLDVRTPPGDLAVAAERDRLFALLADILGNAFRHSRQGDRITVAVGREAGGARITVRDTGRGMPPDLLSRLFLWEWRGEGGASPGAGPGLAMVRREVEAMGGGVSAESEMGRGTAIHLVLPPAP